MEEWLSSMSLITTSRTVGSGSVAQEDEGVPVYVQALLEQSAESIDALQRTIGRGEDERKNFSDNFTILAEKMSAVADQIKNNQKIMQNSSGGMDEATKDHIRNLDISMARLIEEISQGNKRLTSDLRAEIKILAKTFAVTMDKVSSGSNKNLSNIQANEKSKNKNISTKKG